MAVTCCSILLTCWLPLQRLLFLTQTLAYFWTPIEVLVVNNSPKKLLDAKGYNLWRFEHKLSFPSQRLSNAGRQSQFTEVTEDRERLLLSEQASFTSFSLPVAPTDLCQFIVWDRGSDCATLHLFHQEPSCNILYWCVHQRELC